MSILSSLKTAAVADLATAKSTVTNYVAELEASVKANRTLLIATGVASAFLGAVIGHLVK